jgi:dTDP-4-amino-4,6-dideoxygalactose transaminase
MVDLEALHLPLRAELTFAAQRVLASNRFILGDEVAALEREAAAALGVVHAIGVSSGSDALLALLLAAGVGPGDEVVTTAYSFFATAEAILRLGAVPAFVDVDPSTLNIDAAAAVARITRRTKAVVVVHLFGRVAHTQLLEEKCAAEGIPLIEDAAQAIGAWRVEAGVRRNAGALGDGAAISFFPTKNLGGFGDGGMVLTENESLAAKVRLLRNHGGRRRFEHVMIGGNFRLDELQAALLRVKLPHLADWSAERRRIASAYSRGFEGSNVRSPGLEDGCTWNQFVVQVPADHREAVIAGLAARNISSAIYYPIPLHRQVAVIDRIGAGPSCPHAEAASERALALPIYPGLGEETARQIAFTVSELVG